MIIKPSFKPIWWTGKVPKEREGDLRTRASYCTCVQSICFEDIGALIDIWNGGLMRIYIYLSILKVIRTYELKLKYDHESAFMPGK